jgi:hypothetical protein
MMLLERLEEIDDGRWVIEMCDYLLRFYENGTRWPHWRVAERRHDAVYQAIRQTTSHPQARASLADRQHGRNHAQRLL